MNRTESGTPAAGRPRVGFQGEFGAFSEEAVRRFFGADAVEPVPRRDFRSVANDVVAGTVDYGLLPIENTLAGSVVGTYDVLADTKLYVVGEVIVPIHHCLLGRPGAALDGIRRVISHPVALAQCTGFLVRHPELEAVAVYDTAGAAKTVAESEDATTAAIASRAAAERYGLDILAADIEDRHDNQTRFLVVSREDAPLSGPGADAEDHKTALLVETRNLPGALVQVLLPFASRAINLSKLESRPGDEPWSYRFFIEFEADRADPQTRDALSEIERRASTVRVLGSYPRWSGHE